MKYINKIISNIIVLLIYEYVSYIVMYKIIQQSSVLKEELEKQYKLIFLGSITFTIIIMLLYFRWFL